MVLAHIGHWYAEIAYVGPVALTACFLSIQSRREKRRRPAPPPLEDPGSPSACSMRDR